MLGLIQVGLGGFGRRWAEVVRASPDWRHAGLVTRDTTVLAKVGRECGLGDDRLFTDLRAGLMSIHSADAVLVTTPYFRHTEDILLSLRQGKHVLVEKPLCDNLAEAYEIMDVARETDKTLMVSENYRFRPQSLAVRDLVESGVIGTPEFICLHYFVRHAFNEGDWRYGLRYPVLLENSTHHYDLLRFVTGKEVLSVFCAATGSMRAPNWRNPSVSVNLEMEQGLLVSFCASWAYPSFNTPFNGTWWIRGTKGGIRWSSEGILLSREGRETRVPVEEGPDDSLSGVLVEFTEALRQRRPPSVGITDNIKTVEIMVASIESAECKKPIVLRDLRGRHLHAAEGRSAPG